MSDESRDQIFADIVNNITEKLSKVLLEEFLKIPKDLQIGLVLIKSSQLLIANVLCQVAATKDELDTLATEQGPELKELTLNCAYSGFADKFVASKH